MFLIYSSASCIRREHTSAYVSIRLVSIRQHTSAYVSIYLHTSAYFNIRQHTSTYTCIRRSLNSTLQLLGPLVRLRQLFVLFALAFGVDFLLDARVSICTSLASSLTASSASTESVPSRPPAAPGAPRVAAPPASATAPRQNFPARRHKILSY
jgi:hypothetical protein